MKAQSGSIWDQHYTAEESMKEGIIYLRGGVLLERRNPSLGSDDRCKGRSRNGRFIRGMLRTCRSATLIDAPAGYLLRRLVRLLKAQSGSIWDQHYIAEESMQEGIIYLRGGVLLERRNPSLGSDDRRKKGSSRDRRFSPLAC